VSDFVRVKHPLFGHFSTRRPDAWKDAVVTDEPATDVNGKPLPAKPKTSVATKAAEKKSKTPTNGAEPATTPEEGSAS
jgi:hypothetical protein